MPSVTKVAIGVVQSDDHVLVGVRPDGVELAGMTEFPGGKCETGETPRVCVVRECREETGLMVVPREHLTTTTQTYDYGTVELHFWSCDLANDLPDRAAVSDPFRWVPRSELSTLNFPEGNREVLAILSGSE